MDLAKLRKLTAEQLRNIDPQEVFQSPEFAQHLQRLTEEIMKIGGNPNAELTVNVVSQPNGPPAWTNGKDIYVNTENPISDRYARVIEQFIALRGLCFHECAHVLYLDFAEEKKALKSLQDGSFYGTLPEPASPDEAQMLEEMQIALKNPLYRPIFMQVYQDVSNNTDDPHDEGKIIQAFGGIVEQGIVFARESLYRSFDVAENEIAGDGSDLSKLYWLMLEYARFENILVKDEAFFQSDPLMRCVISMAKPIATARWTDDLRIRFTAINQMLLTLWPYIKAELDKLDDQPNPQNGKTGDEGQTTGGGASDNVQSGGNGQQGQQQNPANGQSQQGSSQNQPGGQSSQGQQPGQAQPSGNGGAQGQNGANQMSHSKKAIQQVLEQLQQASMSASQTSAPTPKDGKTSVVAAANRKAARKGKQAEEPSRANDVKSDLSSAQSMFDKLKSEIAERKALDAAERDLTSNMMVEIDKTAKGIDCPCVLSPSRNLAINDSDIELYHKQMDAVEDYSKRLKRRMDEALRDMRDGGVKHHRQMGRIIEAQYAYRPDQRYFASKKMPQDWPTMAISILVDLSGSMRGERLDSAMKATMLLYDFATGLGIPVFVAGHNAIETRINYNVMAEFDGVDLRDRYRLAHMYLAGDNYDGVAIEVSASLLAKRPEDVKLLFIISDGQPNHGAYRGETAKKDIQEIVTKYRRKGVITFATAIGSDRDKIREIYGDGYLDISDLSAFPKQLTRMVAKRLIRV